MKKAFQSHAILSDDVLSVSVFRDERIPASRVRAVEQSLAMYSLCVL